MMPNSSTTFVVNRRLVAGSQVPHIGHVNGGCAWPYPLGSPMSAASIPSNQLDGTPGAVKTLERLDGTAGEGGDRRSSSGKSHSEFCWRSGFRATKDSSPASAVLAGSPRP